MLLRSNFSMTCVVQHQFSTRNYRKDGVSCKSDCKTRPKTSIHVKTLKKSNVFWSFKRKTANKRKVEIKETQKNKFEIKFLLIEFYRINTDLPTYIYIIRLCTRLYITCLWSDIQRLFNIFTLVIRACTIISYNNII